MAYPRVSPPGRSASTTPPPDDEPAQGQAEPAPTVKPVAAPPEHKHFPCAQCGASLKYCAGVQSLTCEYCGHVQAVPQSAEQVSELDYEAYFRSDHYVEAIPDGVTGARICDGCGGEVLLPATVAADFCPFCGKHVDNPITTPTAVIKPWAVLPFKIPQEQAREFFVKWVGSRWFAPNAFKRLVKKLERLQGIYLPFWTYDAMTWSHYTGYRGDDYTVTVGSGKDRRTETRTRWTYRSGRIDHWFDDVVVPAAKSVPEKHARALEPWDLKALTTYAPEYLAGHRVERYQKGPREGFVTAREIMDETIRQLIRSDIGGDRQRISTVNTQYGGVTFKHVLLPVWVAAYQFKGKTWHVLVNARTGEVQGDRPWSAWKIGCLVVFILAIIGSILFLILSNS